MSYITCPRVKKTIFVLPLLLLLVFFLIGCGNSNSAVSTSGSNASQTPSSQSQDGTPNPAATSVVGGDDQLQTVLPSLDQSQNEADNAANTGDQQDTNPNP